MTVTATVYDSPWTARTSGSSLISSKSIRTVPAGSIAIRPPEGTPTPTPISILKLQHNPPCRHRPLHQAEIIVDVGPNQPHFNPADPFILMMDVLNTGEVSLPDHCLALVVVNRRAVFRYGVELQFDCGLRNVS